MFNEELIAAKVAARNAGKILMKYYKSEDNEVKMKGIGNLRRAEILNSLFDIRAAKTVNALLDVGADK